MFFFVFPLYRVYGLFWSSSIVVFLSPGYFSMICLQGLWIIISLECCSLGGGRVGTKLVYLLVIVIVYLVYACVGDDASSPLKGQGKQSCTAAQATWRLSKRGATNLKEG